MLQPDQRRVHRTQAFVDQTQWKQCANEGKGSSSQPERSVDRICLSLGKNDFSALSTTYNLQRCNMAKQRTGHD